MPHPSSRSGRRSRRDLYRAAKRQLYRMLSRHWHGPLAQLRRLVRDHLHQRDTAYLRRLLRHHAFAAAVAIGLLTGASSYAGNIPPIELSDIATGNGGFIIIGIDVGDLSGYSVSGAGDVNGDGLADLLIGAYGADPGGDFTAGESYVVFGKTSPGGVRLSEVAAGTGGFVINGIDAADFSGFSVSGVGDVNGDGLADLLVGAFMADPGGDTAAGESYVVFGKTSTAPVELSDIAAGTGGFVINGIDAYDRSGGSVSGAGDVNGDGLADLLIGAFEADPGGDTNAGESYVVFGKSSTAPVELADVAAGTGGFVINGTDAFDRSGDSVSGAGDVNGDGVPDLLVGAFGGDSAAGESYVIFGPSPPIPLSWLPQAIALCACACLTLLGFTFRRPRKRKYPAIE